MIAFGKGNTLLTFIDKYYKYDSKQDIQDKGLTIGSYKSAVTPFVLENTAKLFDETIYNGIYGDDGCTQTTCVWNQKHNPGKRLPDDCGVHLRVRMEQDHPGFAQILQDHSSLSACWQEVTM
jgi:hypothetical protein